jgi:hypothetical protein
MESKAFHICPFCQSPSPASASRCARCDRSLAGLPLPTYGSELDAASMRSEPRDLVDLPLRDGVEATPAPVTAAVTAPTAPRPRIPPTPKRRRVGRTAKVGVAAAMMGGVLIGGWLVRAQGTSTSAPAADVPDTTLSASPATVGPDRVATRMPVPDSGPRTSAPARRTSIGRGAAPVRQAAARENRPAPPADDATEVYTVHPDVRAAPVDAERMPEDRRRDSTADAHDQEVRTDLRARLGRAEQRRQVIAERVSQLRARTNVPVIKDVAEYQRLQEQLSAALDELDRVEAEIARLRRGLGRGRE